MAVRDWLSDLLGVRKVYGPSGLVPFRDAAEFKGGVTVADNASTGRTDITITGGGGGDSSPLTTKGDLYTHDGTVDARLAVGANGLVLVADSAAATGQKWAQLGTAGIADASVTAPKLSGVDLEYVLGQGADAADIGIANLGGATITAAQAVNYLGEIDLQRQSTSRLTSTADATRIHAGALANEIEFYVGTDRTAFFQNVSGAPYLVFDQAHGPGTPTAFIVTGVPAANQPGMTGLYLGGSPHDDGGTSRAGGDAFVTPTAGVHGGDNGKAGIADNNATPQLYYDGATGNTELDKTAIATAQTYGFRARNTTAATGGATQQYSPLTGWLAHGWDGSASDLTIESAWQLQPQGADTDGTSHLALLSQVDGGGWQQVARYEYGAGDPTTAPAFLLNGSVNSHVRLGAVDVSSSQPAPGSRLQASANAGAGDDGDVGLYDAAGNARVVHDASDGTTKIGDVAGGTEMLSTPSSTEVRIHVQNLTFDSAATDPTIKQNDVADAAGAVTTLEGQGNDSLASKAGSVVVAAGFNANTSGESGDLELRVQSSFADAGEIGKLTVHEPNNATETKLAWNEHTVAFNGVMPTSGMLQSYTFTNSNWVATRSFDADNTTLAEIADVLSTLIADLGGAPGSQTTGGYGLFQTDPAS